MEETLVFTVYLYGKLSMIGLVQSTLNSSISELRGLSIEFVLYIIEPILTDTVQPHVRRNHH